MKTKNKFIVCRRSNPTSNIFKYIKDVYIEYYPINYKNISDPRNSINMAIRQVDSVKDLCCITVFDNITFINMESPDVKAIIEKDGFNRLLHAIDWGIGSPDEDTMFCDVSSIVMDGCITTEHPFFDMSKFINKEK